MYTDQKPALLCGGKPQWKISGKKILKFIAHSSILVEGNIFNS